MIELIQQRLASYNVTNPVEEEQATKEIIQEAALYGLWRAEFFQVAAFQGGTSLRILHGLPRFSEDLDFILKKTDMAFQWQHYLDQLLDHLAEFGLKAEALDKSRMDQRVKKAVLKDSSVCNQLKLSFYSGNENQKLKIKLEVDVNPPAHSGYDYSYLDFPLDFEVCHQDLPSNFALKIHALLCRPYVKARDWFDFNWYVKNGVQPNLQHLQSALVQYGPWSGMDIKVDQRWLHEALQAKVKQIDWEEARKDVERFLKVAEQRGLQLWSKRFFSQKVNDLRR